jgi:hypothetical protein
MKYNIKKFISSIIIGDFLCPDLLAFSQKKVSFLSNDTGINFLNTTHFKPTKSNTNPKTCKDCHFFRIFEYKTHGYCLDGKMIFRSTMPACEYFIGKGLDPELPTKKLCRDGSRNGKKRDRVF